MTRGRGARGRARAWLVAAGVALAACRGEVAPREEACRALRLEAPPGHIPVVLVVNDTMRRDRVGVYGGPARTPAFDRFARENLYFDAAFTQAPWTLPSIATLFTSLYPSQHGMLVQPGARAAVTRLADGFTTLAEVFRAAGYVTAAFVSNPWMKAPVGFEQGFDLYRDDFAAWDQPGVALSEAALAWLDSVPPERPFLLYLHYIDSHRPYPALTFDELRAQVDRVRDDRREVPPEVRLEIAEIAPIDAGGSLVEALIERRIALVELAYEKGLAEFDRALDVLLAGLARSPAAARAAVIVTSDHGEALYERGYGNHGQGLHDDELAVPLAARLPGVAAAENPVRCPVGLIDLLPTLCRYLDLACPATTFGRSLLGGASGRRYVVSEGVGSQPHHRAIRAREWKLLYAPGHPPDRDRRGPYPLYRVSSDPGERHDLAASDDPDARAALERLRREVATAVPPFERPAPEVVPIDPAAAERLRALGYLEEPRD